jgi:hypothetical protein
MIAPDSKILFFCGAYNQSCEPNYWQSDWGMPIFCTNIWGKFDWGLSNRPRYRHPKSRKHLRLPIWGFWSDDSKNYFLCSRNRQALAKIIISIMRPPPREFCHCSTRCRSKKWAPHSTKFRYSVPDNSKKYRNCSLARVWQSIMQIFMKNLILWRRLL